MIPLAVLSESTFLVLLTAVCAALFLIGVRILLVFGAWALGFVVAFPGYQPINLTITAYSSLNSFVWVAIPVFVIVGGLINEFGLSEDITEFATAVAGWLPGTVGNTAVYTSGVFSAITGSNEATTASVGEALFEDLTEEGYSSEFAAATVASGGTLGIIIPPSVLLILYGVTFNISVPVLFAAGLIPGLTMMVGLSAVCSYKAYANGYGVDDYEFDATRIARAAWNAKHAAIVIVLLVGGVLLGFFTPSESAGAAFAYIVFIGVVTRRFTSFEQIKDAFETGVFLIGFTIPLYATSIFVQQSLSFIGVEQAIANAITSLPATWMVFAVVVVILLLTGSVLSSLPNMILTAPLLAPVATGTLGLTPLTWGIVFMMSDAIGFITPPYGLNLFVISEITGQDYMRVAFAALPYLLVLIGVWLMFFLFPELNILAPT